MAAVFTGEIDTVYGKLALVATTGCGDVPVGAGGGVLRHLGSTR